VCAIDPDEASLVEAEQRAKSINFGVHFLGKGTIVQAAFAGPFDVVCYNFSLHYIMDDFQNSIRAINCALKPGGLLIGIVPDPYRASMIADKQGHYEDDLGNSFDIVGEKLVVKLSDGPFYADGPKAEPLLDYDLFIKELKNVGIYMLKWDKMVLQNTGKITDLYSKFIFKKM